eukprot:1160294-Pelagomonas_calceolata.AAC.3
MDLIARLVVSPMATKYLFWKKASVCVAGLVLHMYNRQEGAEAAEGAEGAEVSMPVTTGK